MQNSRQIDGLNVLKIVLSIFVVLIHTRPFIGLPTVDAFLTNGIFRAAVPIFFILNGYFFTFEKVKFLGWFKKLVSLYIFLSFFYVPIWLKISNQSVELKDIAYNFLIGWHQLWYLQALILASGLIYLMKEHKSLLFLISIVFFLIGLTVEYVSFFHTETFFDFFQKKYFLYRNFITIGVPFILMGIYLRGFNRKVPRLLLIFSIVAFLVEIIILSLNKTTLPFHKDLFFSLLFICPCIVLIAREIKVNFKDHYSAKVFYFHPLFEM